LFGIHEELRAPNASLQSTAPVETRAIISLMLADFAAGFLAMLTIFFWISYAIFEYHSIIAG
jgi:hypothetical protein